MLPPLRTTRRIERDSNFRRLGSRIELKTVIAKAISKLSSGKDDSHASSQRRFVPCGHFLRASRIRLPSKSTPYICSGEAPAWIRNLSHAPVPQPTSKILLSERSVTPFSRNNSRILRSTSCSRNNVSGFKREYLSAGTRVSRRL